MVTVLKVAVMERDTGLRFLTGEEIDAAVAEIEAEKAAADAARRGGQAGASAS